MKAFFFDRAAVIAAMDAKTRKSLSKAGAFVMTTARRSMRRRKASSAPGSPPSVHVGWLKNLLYFAYDPRSKSVVIGPELFRGSKSQSNVPVPNVLEFGGTAKIRRGGAVHTVKVLARPFMAPALEKELPNLPSRWSGTLKD